MTTPAPIVPQATTPKVAGQLPKIAAGVKFPVEVVAKVVFPVTPNVKGIDTPPVGLISNANVPDIQKYNLNNYIVPPTKN